MVNEHELNLQAIYQRRFDPDLAFRRQMWQILCRDFFQNYIPADSSILEVAAGYCEFINNIEAKTKIAIDLNPNMQRFAEPDVVTFLTSSTDMSMLANDSIDIAFTSNFFEHLSRADISQTMQEVKRVLKPDGRFLILQPNIRFCYRDYWMFFDHLTPLDDRSLAEALETNGFAVIESIPRFLPYTTKSRLPKSLLLIKMYLRLPLFWRLFGAQAFVVARPNS